MQSQNLLFLKIRSYLPSTDNVPAQVAPKPKPSQPTAQDIFRLPIRGQGRGATSQKTTLEMEVDQYLSNPNPGTGSVEFWQVCFYFFFYN